MSKVLFAFALCFFPLFSFSQNWQNVGNDPLRELSGYHVVNLDALISESGEIYVAYIDEQSDIYLKKWNGIYWQIVGGTKVNTALPYGATGISVALDASEQPYLFITRTNQVNEKGQVLMFDGNTWKQVGDTGFGYGSFENPVLKFNRLNNPIIAYRETFPNKIFVRELVNGIWTEMGNNSITNEETGNEIRLDFDGFNNPVLLFREEKPDSVLQLRRYANNSWYTYGPPIASSYFAKFYDFQFNKNDSLILMYTDLNDPNHINISKLSDTNWNRIVNDATFQNSIATNFAIDSLGRYVFASQAGDTAAIYTVSATNIQKTDSVIARVDFAKLAHAGNKTFLFEFQYQYFPRVFSVNNNRLTRFPGSEISTGWSTQVDFAEKSNGIKMIAYQDYGEFNGVAVKEFDGVNWLDVGQTIPIDNANNIALAVDNNDIPYIFAVNSFQEYFLSFENGVWSNLPTPDFDGKTPDQAKMIIRNNNNIVLSYLLGSEPKCKVYLRNSGVWIDFGGTITTNNVNILDLTTNPVDAKPYVAFGWYQSGYTVKKWVNNNWITVGDSNISNQVSNLSLAVSSQDIPYVAFISSSSTRGYIQVKKFDSGQWVSVDSLGLDGVYAESFDLAFDTNDNLFLSYTRGFSNAYQATINVLKLTQNQWSPFADNIAAHTAVKKCKMLIDKFDNVMVAYHGTYQNKGDLWIQGLGPSIGIIAETKEEVKSEIKIWPTPGTGVYTVSYKSIKNQKMAFTIFNVMGLPVFQGKLVHGSARIDLSNKPAGQYILKLENGISTKILKQ